jgi:hypothetical protein
MTARRCGVAGLILGVLSLGALLAWQVAVADLGSDLGIDGRGFRVAFFLGSWILAGMAVLASGGAAFLAPGWAARAGTALPGLMTAAMTVVGHTILR